MHLNHLFECIWWLTDRPTKLTDGLTDRPTNRPTDQLTDRPTDQPTNQSTDRPTDQLTNRSTDRPTDQLTNRSTDWPTDGPTNQPTNRSTDWPTDGPTNQLTNRPTNRPTDRPTNQPTDQLTDRTDCLTPLCMCTQGHNFKPFDLSAPIRTWAKLINNLNSCFGDLVPITTYSHKYLNFKLVLRAASRWEPNCVQFQV